MVIDNILAYADEQPHAVAFQTSAEAISYAQLAQQAHSLAKQILAVNPTAAPVAIAVATPRAAVAALLAAQIAGAAAIPVDLGWPSRRKDFVLDDAGVGLVVTETDGAIDVYPRKRNASGHEVPRGTAYVMYTSGTTGRPKGVVVSFTALHDRLAGLAEALNIGIADSILATTSLSFDISLAELLLPLFVGAKIAAAPPHARSDPRTFARAAADLRPSIIQGTPSLYRLLIRANWTGAPEATLWCGGEPMTPALSAQLQDRAPEVWNLYGPTEATIWATSWKCHGDAQVSLGTALPGVKATIRDEHGKTLNGSASVGELVLSGTGIATGYLGLPELTSRQFVQTAEGKAAYLTGDLVEFDAAGDLLFRGRNDNQLKIRGHRIEPGEIESTLEQYPAISQAAVVVTGTPEQPALAAFVVASADLDLTALRAWLWERLPRPMVPGAVHAVQDFPRTSAGKVDRFALRALLAEKDR